MTTRRSLVWAVGLLLAACGGGSDGGTGGAPEPLPPPADRVIRDPYFVEQWNLNPAAGRVFGADVDVDAHIHGSGELTRYTGRGVRIAIIDDGLDLSHEDLQGAVVATYNLSRNDSRLDPVEATASHGTAVTGIIAAQQNTRGITGIAPEAEVLFVEYDRWMTDSDMLSAFAQAEAFGADVINCSWGTYDVSPSVREKIQDLARHGRGGRGIAIVYAVGNEDRSMAHDESAIPEVIAVAASNEYNERASYSNYGPELDLLAPGGEWLGIATLDAMGGGYGVAAPWSDPDYLLADDDWAFKGTSAAAPTVTGVIALMLEIDPQLTVEKITELLHRTADRIGPRSYLNGHNDYYGYGKVNLGAVVREVRREQTRRAPR